MTLLRSLCLLTVVSIAGAAVSGSLLQRASARASRQSNPFETNGDAKAAGAKLYARECAACHGSNREGRTRVPPLDRQDIREAAPGTLFWVLRNGDLTRGMPSFAHLPDAQRWQIITFLQTGGKN